MAEGRGLMFTDEELRAVADLVAECEQDMRRRLSRGEMSDLVADNRCDEEHEWSLDKVHEVVAALTAGHGPGPVHKREARGRHMWQTTPHPFGPGGGGLSQPLRREKERQYGRMTHREMVYMRHAADPRKYKRFAGLSTSEHHMEEAYFMGQATIMSDVTKRWRTNPYPPGARHDQYDEGVRDAQRTRDEQSTERRWQGD